MAIKPPDFEMVPGRSTEPFWPLAVCAEFPVREPDVMNGPDVVSVIFWIMMGLAVLIAALALVS